MASSLHTQSCARYKDVTEEKADGATFTPRNLARFVAKQIAPKVQKTDDRPIRVLDPAIGEGVLLLCLLEELHARGFRDFEVHGFDTNERSIRIAESAIRAEFPLVSTHFRSSSFLAYAEQFTNNHPLFRGGLQQEKPDVIIANPPYVRTQIMGGVNAQALAANFGLAGRVDLYHAFLLGMIEVLGDNGVAGIIVSNRFMTTKSGSVVRRVLREATALNHIWDLGDTKLFGAAVLPAVILLTKSAPNGEVNPGFTSIYEIENTASTRVNDVIAALAESGAVSIEDGRHFQVTQGVLDLNSAADGVWRVANEKTDAWLDTVENHTWRTFGQIGSIRVGIKTCADRVFIRSDWKSLGKGEQPELLRPLTTHHMGRRFRADDSKAVRRVLYPHLANDGRREVADLTLFPKSAAYLEKHRSALESRTYVLEGGRKWYEIWVPQDPAAWDLPKLVFRDICEKPTFWIDLDGTIVNGDCYWLTPSQRTDADLLWLALAIANSSFIETFYDHRFNNKLYAGRRRFITQYVECFPLPNPTRPEAKILASLAKEIYNRTPVKATGEIEDQLDELVWHVFGVNQSKKSAGNGI